MHSKKPVWNKDKDVGQKRPFTPQQIETIARHLETEKQFRNLCLLCLGIDTMLRGIDLVRLKVCDVTEANGHVKDVFTIRQRKNKKPVKTAITPYTASTICCHVTSSGLVKSDFLFASNRNPAAPLSTSYLRRLVKSWAELAGLNSSEYAGHSLRRTKSAFMYAHGVQPPPLRILLGQKSLESTQFYLGVDQENALDLARQHDIFQFQNLNPSTLEIERKDQ